MPIRSILSLLYGSLLVLSLGRAEALAQGGPPPGKGRPPIAFDTLETPLQKAVKQAYRGNADKKKDKMAPGANKDKCAEAIERGNDNQIAQFCEDVGTLTSQDFGGAKDLNHPSGKAAGKRLVTKTTLLYKTPKQKGRSDDPPIEKWPAAKLKAFERVKDHFPGPAIPDSSGGRGRNFGSSFLPEPDANDDHDCIDTLTGEHHAQSACFDEAGKLVKTLSLFTHPSGTPACRHTNGSVFFGNPTDGEEDDCWGEDNVLKTTLVELIDEDGPEQLDNDGDGFVNEDGPGGGNEDNDCIASDGTIHVCGGTGPFGEVLRELIDEDGPDMVDNDGDGQFNEDPPAASATDDCTRFYQKFGLTPTDAEKAGGQCDVSRALVKFVNSQAVAKGHDKLFKAKDDGTFDPEGEKGVEPGKEERKISITESFGVKCAVGTTFFSGVCVPDDELAAAGEAYVASMRTIAGPRSLLAHDEDDLNIANVAMMGFTFAPPVIEWGYRIDEDVCVFGICVEIFYARIGYEFDLAIGLRLPVEIEVLDLPESVLAGTNHTVQTQLEPLDFTTSQFEQFCHEHDLDSDWFIGGSGALDACRRFGFTNFLDEAVPDFLLSPDKKDGDEFVARYSIFAGIQVRVLMIPIINWAIDSSLDLPAACTMMRIFEILKNPGDIPLTDIRDFVQALMGFGDGTEAGVISVLNFIKESSSACGTFTTPFGLDENGDIRGFPFSGTYEIRADCAEAFARGEVITIKGQPRPICTNMILGVSGASLGVGLGLEVRGGSNLIRSQWDTSEDADGSSSIDWQNASNEPGAAVGLTIRADNFDDADHHDTARISFDEFIYFLNLIELALKANLQFGGILSPIPDIGSFNIYRFQVSLGDTAPPIPQHPRTGAVGISIPVENYGLRLNLKPETTDPALLADDDTLRLVPGEFGSYLVGVRNIGSFPGDFDNFRIELSNRPNQDVANLRFGIDENNDKDCRLDAGSPCTLRGFPDCYLIDGTARSDRVQCINEDPPSDVEGLSREERDDDGDGIPDEDPPDVWVTTFPIQAIVDVDPYTNSSAPTDPPAPGQSLRLGVNPFRHPLTSPGIYPVKVTGDSTEAKAKGMAATDPSGNLRKNASDVSFFKVESFFEPQVVVLPNFDGGKPAISKGYTVEGTNGGNSNDSMSVNTAFVDFNQAGCTLTTLGRLPDGSNPNCPYRAVPTVIPSAWTTVGDLAAFLPDPQPGQLEPLGSDSDRFTISPPHDWAGMDDTTYEFVVTTVSQADPGEPAATRSFVARHTVQATKESMTRYLGLEIAELIATLEAAEAAGLKLGGLTPIAVKPIQMNNDRALEAILAGDLGRASGIHSTGIHLVEAFARALNGGGKSLPPAVFADLHARVAAMLADLAMAETSMVPSAP